MYLINFDLVLQQTLLHLGVGRHHATRGQATAEDGEEDGDHAHVVSRVSLYLYLLSVVFCVYCVQLSV